jgi:formylglycine-generating enzyme required for sulfatase activity
MINDLSRRAREALADCFPEVGRARLLAQDAGLRLAGIDLSGAPVIFWQAILDEAARQGRIDALLGRAIEQAPARQELKDLRGEYASYVRTIQEPPPAAPTPAAGPTPAPSAALRAALRQAMNDKLDIEEVRTACFDLGIDPEDLRSDTKGALIIGLIGRVERTERGPELIAWLRANRPDYRWPVPYRVVTPLVAMPGSDAGRAFMIESPFHLELVRVPAGEFLMGSDSARDPDADDREKPQSLLNFPEFYIGLYPVTVAQYVAFLQASGYKTTAEQGVGMKWETGVWQDAAAGWQHPGRQDAEVSMKADHPATLVSWHDALAFCRWLSEESGRVFRLPTEAEWEKAARGTDGRIYPWGNKAPDASLCNFDGSLISGTTPVSMYPAGASPYGSLDMAGNVWEWTSSVDRPNPYDGRDGREDLNAPDTEARIMRGGAFNYPARDARCSFRGWSAPIYTTAYVGFRVATSS